MKSRSRSRARSSGISRAQPPPLPRARPSCRRSRPRTAASGCRRGRSRRSCRRCVSVRRGPPAEQALRARACRRASSPRRTRAGSPRAAAPGSTRRCSRRWWRRCRAAGWSRRSLICTVFSSRMRLPASQDSTMFCAIWSWARPRGRAGRRARPWKETAGRGRRAAPELARGQVEDLPSRSCSRNMRRRSSERRRSAPPSVHRRGVVQRTERTISSTSSVSRPRSAASAVGDEQRRLVVGDRPERQWRPPSRCVRVDPAARPGARDVGSSTSRPRLAGSGTGSRRRRSCPAARAWRAREVDDPSRRAAQRGHAVLGGRPQPSGTSSVNHPWDR